jgi:glutathione S-transferase
MVLNFKRIPYTQSFISYPDIAPLMKALSVPPLKEMTPYTLPAIVHKASITSPESGAMMDSLPIALHLDKTFPDHPLFPSGTGSYMLAVAVDELTRPVIRNAVGLIMPNVADFLDERGQKYFRETREKRFKKPLAELRPQGEQAIAEARENAKKAITQITDVLKNRKLAGCDTGPFFEGDEPGYADLTIVSFLAWFERADRPTFEKLLEAGSGELKPLWDACLPWLDGQGKEREWKL